MDNTMMVILIVGIVAAVMAGVCLLFPMLIRKGLNLILPGWSWTG